jgi:hypothetical protein
MTKNAQSSSATQASTVVAARATHLGWTAERSGAQAFGGASKAPPRSASAPPARAARPCHPPCPLGAALVPRERLVPGFARGARRGQSVGLPGDPLLRPARSPAPHRGGRRSRRLSIRRPGARQSLRVDRQPCSRPTWASLGSSVSRPPAENATGSPGRLRLRPAQFPQTPPSATGHRRLQFRSLVHRLVPAGNRAEWRTPGLPSPNLARSHRLATGRRPDRHRRMSRPDQVVSSLRMSGLWGVPRNVQRIGAARGAASPNG